MATFEDIKKANEAIATMDIKGKEYAMVNQRIKAFRMVYPEGSIITELIQLENGVCTIKATVSNGDTILGTGYAQEKESSSYINKTSYIENAETSCVGRALGMCGFGIDTSICSAEELQNALAQQEANKKPQKPAEEYITEAQRAQLNEYYKTYYKKDRAKLNKDIEDSYGVTSLAELKRAQAQALIDRIAAQMAME